LALLLLENKKKSRSVIMIIYVWLYVCFFCFLT